MKVRGTGAKFFINISLCIEQLPNSVFDCEYLVYRPKFGQLAHVGCCFLSVNI